ncbi:hypothetical protein [Psychroserpens sp.]
MAEVSKKRIIKAGLIGGAVFSIVVLIVDKLMGRDFSWLRLVFYFVFGVIMYGFLTYRSFKRHQK